jgi:glycosyltransferase involved in cell wall biosynthesis
VDTPGWVDEATLFRYLATADLGLDASLQAEVSPVKAAEYMAFGLPFVAFDLPETRRTGGDAALYVPPGDVAALGSTLDSILRDDRQREAMGRRARKRAETDLVWDRQEPTYLAAFNDLVEPSRETRSALPS